MPTSTSLFVQIRTCEEACVAWSKLCIWICAALLAVMVAQSNDSLACWSGIAFNTAVLGMRMGWRKSQDPFVLVFLAFSLIYVEVPVAFMSMSWPEYVPSTGLSFDLPAPTESTVGYALVFLLAFYVGFAVAIRAIALPTRASRNLPSGATLGRVLPVALALLAFSYAYDNYLSASLTLSSPGVLVEVAKFLSYDAAIVFLLFVVLMASLPSGAGAGRTGMLYMGIAGGFFALHTVNSSKGALLVLLFLAFVLPLAVLVRIRHARMIVPRVWVLGTLAIAAPLVFIGAQVFRHMRRAAAMEGKELGFNEAFARLSVDGGVLQNGGSELFSVIGDRLSTAFNRYIVFYEQFDPLGNSAALDALNFPTYLVKSFINLHMPGTPYPEAYFPSSMMVERIVQRQELLSGDLVSLQTSLNSQPFSIFGLSLLMAGVWAPLLFMAVVMLLRVVLRRWGFYASVWSLVLFNGLLSCYGAEAAFQASVSFCATIAVALYVARILARRGHPAAGAQPA
jgi:hypothetical protein